MKEFIKLVFKFTLIIFTVIALIIGSICVYAKVTGVEIIDMPDNIFGNDKYNISERYIICPKETFGLLV